MEMNWFRKKEKTPELQPAGGSLGPAVQYVEWLMQSMLTQSVSTVLVNELTLTGGGHVGKAAPPSVCPALQLVVNRLKVLTGLNPMPYSDPVKGRYEVRRGPHILRYEVLFHDHPLPPRCTVRLHIRRP